MCDLYLKKMCFYSKVERLHCQCSLDWVGSDVRLEQIPEFKHQTAVHMSLALANLLKQVEK
jgi:hypothetical protein